MVAMRKALLAVTFLFALPDIAAAAELRPFYTKHCWKRDSIPTMAEFHAKDGALFWNGTRLDWPSFQSALADLAGVIKRTEDGNIFIAVHNKLPHEREIVAILAKQGLTLHHCEEPGGKIVHERAR